VVGSKDVAPRRSVKKSGVLPRRHRSKYSLARINGTELLEIIN
tara:strand:+ start:4823 stop:4951 length:129 start_codon:yes stop_codon:yes gene_type:complete